MLQTSWRSRAVRGAFVIAALIACLCAGCVERKLLLRSDPPGARVMLNGVDVGATPVDVPFQTYGVFEVVASVPHRARLRTVAPISPPWWETIPLDFFLEVLWPGTVHDYQTVTLNFPPLVSDEAGVTQREGELRRRMEAGEPAPEGTQP